MKKFEILRYLKRFSLLIFLVSLAGAAAIYLYADGRQKYTASVIIRYTNDGISDGYTPDGSELDVNEIYSSTVISQAMDALGASGRLSTIRSNISVTPVISEDQQTINDALLQKGEEVTYFPDTPQGEPLWWMESRARVMPAICWMPSSRATAPIIRKICGAETLAQPLVRSAGQWLRLLRVHPHSGKRYQRDAGLSAEQAGALPEFFAPPAPATPMQTCAISIPTSKIHHPGAVRLCAQRPQVGRHGAAGNIWPTPSKLQSRTNRSPPSSGTVCGA